MNLVCLPCKGQRQEERAPLFMGAGPKERLGEGLSHMYSFSSPKLRSPIKCHISLSLGRVREECFRSVSPGKQTLRCRFDCRQFMG